MYYFLLLIFVFNEPFEANYYFFCTASDNENLEDSINEEQDGIWFMLPSFKFPPGKTCSYHNIRVKVD